MGRMTISFGQNCIVIWAELHHHLGRMTTSFRQNDDFISAESHIIHLTSAIQCASEACPCGTENQVTTTKSYYFALRRGNFAYRQKYFCVYAQGVLRVRKSEIASSFDLDRFFLSPRLLRIFSTKIISNRLNSASEACPCVTWFENNLKCAASMIQHTLKIKREDTKKS